MQLCHTNKSPTLSVFVIISLISAINSFPSINPLPSFGRRWCGGGGSEGDSRGCDGGSGVNGEGDGGKIGRVVCGER